MKKLIIIISSIAVVGFAILSGIWHYGKTRIDGEIDKVVLAQKNKGFDVTYDARSIAGYPLGYDIELTNLSAGAGDGSIMLTSPWLRGSSGLTDIGVLKLTFAPEQVLKLITESDGSEDYTIDIKSKNMTLEITPEDDLQKTALEANELHLISDRSIEDLQGDVIFTNFIMEGYTNNAQTDIEYAVTYDQAVINYQAKQDENNRTDTSATIKQGQIDMDYSASAQIDYASITRENYPEKIKDIAFKIYHTTGEVTSESLIETTQYDAPIRLDTYSGSSNAEITLDNGQALLKGLYENIKYILIPEGALQDVFEENATVEMSETTLEYNFPISGSTELQDARIQFGLADINSSENIWQLVDPDQAFSRDMAQVNFDVSTKIDMPDGIMKYLEQQRPPQDVTLNDLLIETSGAQVSAKGAVDFTDGAPNGKFDLTAINWKQLLKNAVKAKMLSAEEASQVNVMLGIFLRADEDEMTYRSEIEIIDGLPVINGIPIGTLLGQ